MHEPFIGLIELRRYFSKDVFAGLCGIEIIEAGPGFARVRMIAGEQHLNGLLMVHGGALFTLADMACAAAAHTRGRVAVAVNTTISFVKAGKADTLYAEAHEESRNHKLATYSGKVTDSAGETLALFQGMAYLKAGHLTQNEE